MGQEGGAASLAGATEQGAVEGAGALPRPAAPHGVGFATLAVRIGDIWFTSYFFDPSEIEFTFDPRDVVDESGFAAVESFMRRMGNACGKRVVMTMESWTDHVGLPAMLEYRP
ncbi:hypothetical protein QRN89_13395 [Streptomyces chengbuensis]|uniref:hypothetical protein n=1 Tax=Streptomyces TaxID=1883 RepID=UPI0025B4972D|nr:hypothetical protein [Streptomyces sp. HUAS CB01]WJY55076.1 hypothetical protein QRN89_13395 [Streptomyces sp. HUAS CB01]